MDITVLLINAIATPILVLLTMYARSRISSGERREKREDAYIDVLTNRVTQLEKDLQEVRVELKNRDVEYVELFQKYTSLRAKHEVLLADFEITKRELHATQAELTALKDDIKKKANLAAGEMQKL